MTDNRFSDLKIYAEKISSRSILNLFDEEGRAEKYSLEALGMLFDFSKTQIDQENFPLLLNLVKNTGVLERRDAMFSGEKINKTEGRAVLHTALRNLDGADVFVDDENVIPEVHQTLEKMSMFARDVRDGKFKGQGGAITDVVNIGIGGSDLGPAMTLRALSPYHNGPECHFVSNVDGADIAEVLQGLNPETTLIIVASKTFTTIETMTNARTARAWMSESIKNPAAQFVALSSAQEHTAQFGIAPERVFGFEDWVGGRYSMWGPIGLSIMIAVGPDAFRAMLRGAQAMDLHFKNANPSENMPILLALVGIWHNQILGHATRAVLPYDNRLSRLPAYLQQLEMESNGKSVGMDGNVLPYHTGPIVWGEPGTNGQHAFYQLIHQGTRVVPCEFIVAAQGHETELEHHHTLLLANCLAQSEALMRGRSLDEARTILLEKNYSGDDLERQAKHRVFAGNRPSTTLIYPQLTPEIFGQLIALYEHRVFVEGVILGINSYDQWGVELGKELATRLEPIVSGEEAAGQKDGSTRALVNFIHKNRA